MFSTICINHNAELNILVVSKQQSEIYYMEYIVAIIYSQILATSLIEGFFCFGDLPFD